MGPQIADTALRYRLEPGPEAGAALQETFERYRQMMEMLDLIAADHSRHFDHSEWIALADDGLER